MSGSVLDMIANPKVAQIQQPNFLETGLSAARLAYLGSEIQKTQAQQAAGKAFLDSIDPETGQPNQSLLLQNLKANPATAYAAQTSAQQGQTLDQETFKTHMARLTGVSNAQMALWSQYNGRVPQDAVFKELDEQGPKLGLSPAEIAHAKTQFTADPVANGNTILRNQSMNLSAQDALIKALPPTGTIDTGQYTTGITTNAPLSGRPQGQITPTGKPVATGLPSRTTLGGQVTWTTTDGVTHQGTWEQWANDRNSGLTTEDPLVTPPGGGPPQRVPGGNPLLGGIGGEPGSRAAQPPTATPPAPAATQPAATPARPAPTDIPGPRPGDPEKWKASAQAYNEDNETSAAFQSRMFPLAQANALLSKSGGNVVTGPGAEAVNRIKGFLQTRATSLGIDTQTIANANFDELNKYLTQVVNSNPFAAASDARLASAVSGNPSAHISTLANRDVIKAMIGLERMKQASFQAFQASGRPIQDYTDFRSQWAKNIDPRAFVLDQMTPEQQEKLAKSLAGNSPDKIAAQAAFKNGLNAVASQPGLMNLTPLAGQ